MSCDLLAFDPAAVDDAGLDGWWTLQQWREDLATSSPLVDGFVRELQRAFPSRDAPEVARIEERSEGPELFDRASASPSSRSTRDGTSASTSSPRGPQRG